MKNRYVFIFALIFIISLSASNILLSQNTAQSENQDSLNTVLLFNHLRNNFDDIHDVSMRFHHLDHNLNGVILINMQWENGKMIFSSIEKNETGNKDFADEIVKKIEMWNIENLTGPFETSLPLRIQIVGSTDSTFSEKGILTGEVYDGENNPIHKARIIFKSSDNSSETVPDCLTNREGIFVRTLIPVGNWDFEITADGFEKYSVKNINFKNGEHVRQKIMLSPGE